MGKFQFLVSKELFNNIVQIALGLPRGVEIFDVTCVDGGDKRVIVTSENMGTNREVSYADLPLIMPMYTYDTDNNIATFTEWAMGSNE